MQTLLPVKFGHMLVEVDGLRGNVSMAKNFLRVGDPRYNGPEPFAYRLHAYAFLECAEFAIAGIRQSGREEPSTMQNAPIVHLICHATEMFLKLALYKTGSNEQDLRALELRHNLRNLREKCEAEGVFFSDDLKKMIDSLSPIHQKHKLRYLAFVEAPIWLPFTATEMVELTKSLVSASHPSQTS